MLRYVKLFSLLAVLSLCSCLGQRTDNEEGEADTLMVEPEGNPALTLEEEIYEEESEDENLDNEFVDYLFSFIHSPRLQKDRVLMPLIDINIKGVVDRMENFDCEGEFAFLQGDVFTLFYANREEMEKLKDAEDSIMYVDNILLADTIVRSYEFQKREKGWMLVCRRALTFKKATYGSFMNFYARFTADSVYQNQRLANVIRFTTSDPDDENESIEGTIDAEQWGTLDAELPSLQLTNIRNGQLYTNHRMVMVKCEVGSGQQEIFTFDHAGHDWRLISYEN